MRVGLMKRCELVDLLADYADALNAGDDEATRRLDNRLPLPPVSSLLTLLQLTEAVKRVLVPITLSPSFEMELKDRLAQSELTIEDKRPFPKPVLVGTAVSIIGLTLYLLRRSRAVGEGVVTAV